MHNGRMQALDNPFWSSLRSIHAGIAIGDGAAVRYPAEYAPFLGVAGADLDVGESLERLVAPGESVYLLGVAPRVPRGWALEAFAPLAQMVREAPLDVAAGPPIEALSETHRSEVLALTALVYPHYFRERTMLMGRYFGIFEDGRLAAMIGERLGSADTREMSAICTHPGRVPAATMPRSFSGCGRWRTNARRRASRNRRSPASTRARWRARQYRGRTRRAGLRRCRPAWVAAAVRRATTAPQSSRSGRAVRPQRCRRPSFPQQGLDAAGQPRVGSFHFRSRRRRRRRSVRVEQYRASVAHDEIELLRMNQDHAV